MGDSRITLRDGRFVLLEPIGEGSQGRTFDAIDERPDARRSVAIKCFSVRGATSWKDVELAEREANVLKSLSHPNLPQYVDHFEEDGALYLVMEKIEGETLAAYQRRGATLGESDVVRLLRDASEVLDYLHRRAPPVIHRDLKPGNVIRRPDGSFAFVDFGAVRDKLRPKGGSTMVGTFGYMAPEQVQGRALPASDVYAMGATAMAMLTGREPEELPHRGLTISVREALRGQTSHRLVEVLKGMLDPDPDRRASRIAPLLARMDGSRSDARKATARVNGREDGGHGGRGANPAAQIVQRALDDAHRSSRRAERRARHASRRAERAAQRTAQWRTAHARGFPWPARLLFALAFTVGILAVCVATRLVVPVVLTLLSLFVARRPLRKAAVEVRRAGEVAVEGMQSSRRWFLGDLGQSAVDGSIGSRVRVDDHASRGLGRNARPRVAEDDADPENEREDAAPRGEMKG